MFAESFFAEMDKVAGIVGKSIDRFAREVPGTNRPQMRRDAANALRSERNRPGFRKNLGNRQLRRNAVSGMRAGRMMLRGN